MKFSLEAREVLRVKDSTFGLTRLVKGSEVFVGVQVHADVEVLEGN